MFHQITLAGHLGRDPEMRFTPDGTPVTNLSVAVKMQDGTCWMKVTCWGKLAETTNEYLRKGSAVLIVGKLRPAPDRMEPRTWQDNNGNCRASYEITAREVRFLSGSGQRGKGKKRATAESATEDTGFAF